MTRKFPVLAFVRSGLISVAASAAIALAVSSPAYAQHTRPAGDGAGSGTAVPRGGSTSGSAGNPSPAPSGGAVSRGSSGDCSGTETRPVPTYSKPRDGRNATGEA